MKMLTFKRYQRYSVMAGGVGSWIGFDIAYWGGIRFDVTIWYNQHIKQIRLNT